MSDGIQVVNGCSKLIASHMVQVSTDRGALEPIDFPPKWFPWPDSHRHLVFRKRVSSVVGRQGSGASCRNLTCITAFEARNPIRWTNEA